MTLAWLQLSYRQTEALFFRRTLGQHLTTAGTCERGNPKYSKPTGSPPANYCGRMNGLAMRIREGLQRNAGKHCFVHALELDEYWQDRIGREVKLYQFADKYGFALAWSDDKVGAIFVEVSKGKTHGSATRRKIKSPANPSAE